MIPPVRECAFRAHAALQLPQAEYCFVLGRCYHPDCKCGLNYVEQSVYYEGTWLTSNSRTFPGRSIAPMLDFTIRQQRSLDDLRAYLSGEAPWCGQQTRKPLRLKAGKEGGSISGN